MVRATLIAGVLAMLAVGSIALAAPRDALALGVAGIVIDASDDASGPAQIDRSAQTSDEGDDTSMEVVLWTVLAAAIAAGVGLLLYMVRVILGRVQPPPVQPQDDAHH